MTRHAGLICLFVLILPGCGGSPKGDAEMQAYIAAQHETREASYNRPDIRIEELEVVLKKLQLAKQKLADLNLTDDEMKQLREKYKVELDRAEPFKKW